MTDKLMLWEMVQSPTDPEMFAVQGSYLVADCLPIEDAHLIANAPKLLDALDWAVNVSGYDAEGKAAPWLERAMAAIEKVKGELM